MEELNVKQEGEDRRDRRGGGGGNRNNNNRKRRNDDEEDGHYDRRGPPQQRRRYNDGPPRRHYPEAPLPKLRRMFLNIASQVVLPQAETIQMAKDLGDNFDDAELRSHIFDILIQLIIEQPFKIPFLAAVIFYGNDVKSEIVTETLKRVSARTQDALNAGQWTEFKLMLRFLACLQGVYEDTGIFVFLGQLFDTVVDLQSANENDVVGIEIVKIILLTIPYALVAGGERFHEQAAELLKNTGIVASNVLPMEGLIHSYVRDSAETPISYLSIIALLQTQLSNEAESGWTFACIPHFNANAMRMTNDEESLPSAPQMHAFPTLTIPSPVNPGPKPLFPEAYFSLFADQDIETVPKTTDVAASLIRDAVVDTIDQMDFNREVVAKFLVDIDNYWSQGTFAKRGIAFDKFRELGGKVAWKSEDMVIDAIFSQLLKLPSPEHKLVYYHSLITQSCKVAPAAIAPSLGRAIRCLYRSLHIMDLELVNRFLDWFSHHLSNFEFRWRWTEWLEDLHLSNLHPKKAFIIAALDKEIRLSFAKRIRSTVPEDMHPLIPERLDEDNSPDFKYENPETPFAAEGQTLLVQLRKKASADDTQETINSIHEKAVQLGIADPLVPSTDAFVTAICRLGAKSLSHVLSCIERGKERLLQIAETSPAARRQIVASVVEYWKDQPGVAVRIIDILLNYTILAPITVVQWVFGDHMGAGEALTESWVYEMVANTVNKVTKRNRQIALARLQKGLPQEQVEMVDTTLTKDRDASRELFKYIEDAVNGVAEGACDQLIEKESNGELSAQSAELIRAWGKRWHTVFVRKAAVEESVVGEEAVETRIKLLAAEPEPAPDPMQVEINGVAKIEANGDDERY
ncbi:hypothetical protein K504DRAFT_420996 [Pleomassaria siparia CBS 279.74]|uniref:Cap binding protein n=1 Tax=Pleomassaria siparia CBS 279.74 TaxID=1314801 RepID=A0A6G1KPV5_9PLEO|nr:hypothetical protein K504DRAFT_420996 [Pleomassaria siparia CBS 279.74]